VVQNNILVGGGTLVDQASATQVANFSGGDPMFVNQAGFDYHLSAGSPCVDMGQTPGTGDGYALTPDHEYVQPTSIEGRTIVSTIDIGAYELNGAVAAGGAGGGSATGSGSGSSSSGAVGSGGAASSGSGGSSGAGGAGTGGHSSGTGETSGSSGSGGGTAGAKSGCSCGAGGEEPTGAAVAWLALAGALIATRRRRA
jgi:MYXO-CTERM domain-containing protein